VLVCKNIELILDFTGNQKVTCSTYVCGACLGFSFFLQGEGKDPFTSGRVLFLNSTNRDIITRGYNTTEEEIEYVL
jgi:hypothetical protein